MEELTMTKLNLAATEIMNVSSFTRGQARQMLLKVISDNSGCTIEVALYSIMKQLEKIKQAGVKGRVNGEVVEGTNEPS